MLGKVACVFSSYQNLTISIAAPTAYTFALPCIFFLSAIAVRLGFDCWPLALVKDYYAYVKWQSHGLYAVERGCLMLTDSPMYPDPHLFA